MAKRTPSATLRPSKADALKRHDLQKQDVSANCEEMRLNSEPTRGSGRCSQTRRQREAPAGSPQNEPGRELNFRVVRGRSRNASRYPCNAD